MKYDKNLPLAIWMEGKTVDGSKVTLDPAKLFLEDEMVEAGIKLADTCGRGGHLHGFLTSSQHHLVTRRQTWRIESDNTTMHGSA